ncbi:MAG TPA: 23S rRNA (guanosine(2251)-2'-O)-methyltransferase RlmB [Ignavibacteriales bacterium]|nr:23S rRNA (guanosine(2251)-2'-O)-methyltransferase RlmB [Ignavibacteriales bacterium]
MNYIIGRKPVLEALKAKKDIEKIYFLYGQKGEIIDEIKRLAYKNKVKITQLEPAKFNELTPDAKSQGVAALRSSFRYYEIEDIIKEAKKAQYPLIMVLEEIQDPHNLGALMRSAECAGVKGVLITKNNSAPITETVIKASAGAAERLKICKIDNVSRSFEILKKEGFWITGTHLNTDRFYTGMDYKSPIALVMGNEEKGLRKLTAENCDFLVKIPMMGEIQSLNVSVAGGVLLFEILRQRNFTV